MRLDKRESDAKLPLVKRKPITYWPASIGLVADHFGVSSSLIRHLCDTGILDVARDSRGYRLFLEPDVAKLAEWRRQHGRK